MIKILYLVIIFFSFSSCLFETKEQTLPNTFILSLNITGSGSDITDGTDTLSVISNKFFIDGLILKRNNKEDVQYENTEIVASYINLLSDADQQIAGGDIDGGVYTGINLSFEHPDEDNANFNDSDLTIRDNNGELVESYSLVINGVYNSKAFKFKTNLESIANFTFDTELTLPNYNSGLFVTLFSDTEYWFKDSNTGEILNPVHDEEQIFNNIMNSFQIISRGVVR
ncbi:MAG: hypothetical protein WD016_02425 [Balneolaceae bacterium]